MPIYEFECPSGHVIEELAPIGKKATHCWQCIEESDGLDITPKAYRILSPTRTSFVFADTKLKPTNRL